MPKAHSARVVVAGSGRGNQARRRWSRQGLSKVVVTRTRRSPARSSSRVDTSTRRWPTRSRPLCSRSGHSKVRTTWRAARSGPFSWVSIATDVGASIAMSPSGGE